ncbi:M81 family metallopeptidase [Nguyenibacter vanlangensis]|uniref:Microcystinase C n=2 Tax=Nguyenibacter vanlangensis TaxID=1216886 RepID=A0ABZ3D6Z2_9PROT
MTTRPRIAFGGIHTECSTYNPVRSRIEDFRILRGADMPDAPYFAFLRDFDAAFLPLLHARAVPGGPVSRAAYEAMKQEFLDRLRDSLPLDGLYLAMHGAMFVEGMWDAEADWIGAARALVGPDCLVAASYDLHGNVSQPIIDALDIFSAYRTAPHIDVTRTMHRAVDMLVQALRTGIRPRIVWAPVPVLLPGERTSTEDEPAHSLYARLPAFDARPGIWDAALMVGYVWADEPRATAAVVVTGTDAAALEQAAAEIARAYWDARHDFVFGMETGSVAQCVDRALAAGTAPVIVADSGDNPTGGGVGDRADILAAFAARADADGVVFAAIADAAACERAFAIGTGAETRFAIGATLDPAGGRVTLDCAVVRLADHADPREREAVLRHRGLTIVVSARRRPYHMIADFRRLGLDLATIRILVVKSGYLSPELAPLARPALMALSDGVVNQDVAHLTRLRTHRPTFPFDTEFDWTPMPRGQAARRA